MSKIIADAKQKAFIDMLKQEESRNDDHSIDLEIKDVGALKVSLSTLASCPKTS